MQVLASVASFSQSEQSIKLAGARTVGRMQTCAKSHLSKSFALLGISALQGKLL